MKTPSCPECGSMDVALDSFSEWNLEKPEIEHTYNETYCNKCGAIGDYKLIPYPWEENQKL
jgi:transcription initiation factor TFIIIB Brf1 subunit/transcription initiation factor TFIIB